MNSAPNFFIQWLLDFQLAATILLGAAWLARRWIKQPVQRVALGWAVSLACILLVITAALPAWPRWHAVPQMLPAPTIVPGHITTQHPVFPPLSSSEPNPALGTSQTSVASMTWLRRLFLSAMAIVGSWLLWGRIQADWICRRASAAPRWLHVELEKVAGQRTALPRLLLSSQVHNAVALGIRRPTILLPAELAQQADASGLRAVLAHELAHIRNRDLWLLGLFRALLLVLFPHPLYWAMRHTVRASQESVADAVAAGGREHDYADDLIGWMKLVVRQERILAAPAVGIWERPSELSWRITLLMTFPVQATVSRRWRAGTIAAVGVTALGLSLISLRPASAGDGGPAPQLAHGAGSEINPPATKMLASANLPNSRFEVSAEHGFSDGMTNFVYRGHVSVTDHQRFWLNCERLTVSTLPNGQPAKMVAETNMVLDAVDSEGHTNHVTGDRAVFAYSVVTNSLGNVVTNQTLAVSRANFRKE
jgi:beta-lactamase regulating signal transducer with metallopeptidase domain